MKVIRKDLLEQILPRNKEIDEWYELLNDMLGDYEITTPERLAAFLAQCSHESSQFIVLSENLNYSSDALSKLFGKYFKHKNVEAYHRQPIKIANVIYADRMGNGDTESGEGYKFRGRGVIQLTGKENYTKFAKHVNKTLDETIQYLETKRGALHSALWYWDTRNLNAYADQRDIKAITKKINGGYIGLTERTEHYEHALNLMGIDTHHDTDTTMRIDMHMGSKGEQVSALQVLLDIPVDGHFGEDTQDAVMRFQMENDLCPDGIVGPLTWGRMKSRLA